MKRTGYIRSHTACFGYLMRRGKLEYVGTMGKLEGKRGTRRPRKLILDILGPWQENSCIRNDKLYTRLKALDRCDDQHNIAQTKNKCLVTKLFKTCLSMTVATGQVIISLQKKHIFVLTRFRIVVPKVDNTTLWEFIRGRQCGFVQQILIPIKCCVSKRIQYFNGSLEMFGNFLYLTLVLQLNHSLRIFKNSVRKILMQSSSCRHYFTQSCLIPVPYFHSHFVCYKI